MINNKIKYIIIGLLFATGFYLLFGIITALIPNTWFTRMIPANNLDNIFLITNSLLLGTYLGLYYWKKEKKKLCNITSTSGGIAGFFAFSCPICNKILVIIFGTTALMNYLEPIRPILGIISILLLLLGIYLLIKK